jgi:leucyl aminopeptidase
MGWTSIREAEVAFVPLGSDRADLLVLPVFKDDLAPRADAAALLAPEGSPVRHALASGDLKGDPNEVLLVYTGHAAFPRALLLGLGTARELTLERIRAAAASAARRARDLGATRALFALPLPAAVAWTPAEQLAAALEGAYLGTWQYPEFKTVDREKIRSIGTLVFSLPPQSEDPALPAALHRGRVRAQGTLFARDLAHAPANVVTPSALARTAAQVARDEGLECTVLEREDCERLGMGAFLGVARGSEEPPKFIVLEYDPGLQGAEKIALVGKAITFDSGGISIKPAASMHEMKFDMCGGAAVLGAMKSLRSLDCATRVVGVIPTCENLPSGRATKPGDVHKSFVGKTIEVQNTDAEGRLILADALGWVVREHKPAAVIDLATLTGAVVIALGHYGAAVLSNHDGLMARLEAASRLSGERIWRLPIWEEFPEHLKSEVADLKNIADGNAGGGTIAGGAFLREFVEETPWAHIDIAGTAWWEKDRPHLPKGPSGFGVRLLLDLIESYGNKD